MPTTTSTTVGGMIWVMSTKANLEAAPPIATDIASSCSWMNVRDMTIAKLMITAAALSRGANIVVVIEISATVSESMDFM